MAILTGKGQFSFQSQRKAVPKNVQTTTQSYSLHASKVMLKTLQARFQQYMNQELPDVPAKFRKGRGTRDQIANIHWIIEKAREFQKNIYFCFIGYAKAFDRVDHNKLENFKETGVPDHLTASWVTCMQVKKQELEPDMEQWTGSKLGKEYVKAVYRHPFI